MSMRKSAFHVLRKNLANVVSILGVLPLCLLFVEGGRQFLIPLILYNNVMDDLDGILAAKLNIKSKFGADLDNVCDAIAHTMFVMFVGMHFLAEGWVGAACAAASLAAAVAIVSRVVARLDPNLSAGAGSPTNELVRHMLFVLLLTHTEYGLLAPRVDFSPALLLIGVFALHAVTMLVPFKMPGQIRSLTKSAVAISLVNVALIAAWLVPYAAPVVAACFLLMYLFSILSGGLNWISSSQIDAGSNDASSGERQSKNN